MSTPSDDVAEIAGKVEKIVRDLQAEKEQNRRDFPHAASVMDALAIFKPRLVWAEENGVVIGKPENSS